MHSAVNFLACHPLFNLVVEEEFFLLKLKVLGDSEHVQANDVARRTAPHLFLRAFFKCFWVEMGCRSSPWQRGGIPGQQV